MLTSAYGCRIAIFLRCIASSVYVAHLRMTAVDPLGFIGICLSPILVFAAGVEIRSSAVNLAVSATVILACFGRLICLSNKSGIVPVLLPRAFDTLCETLQLVKEQIV